MLTSSETASWPDVIINACDPMQNPDQTQIFYKAGQTRLTRAKRDLVDPTRFQPCKLLSYSVEPRAKFNES